MQFKIPHTQLDSTLINSKWGTKMFAKLRELILSNCMSQHGY